MRKIVLASSVAIALIMSACSRTGVSEEENKQVLTLHATQGNLLNIETNTITTFEDFTSIDLYGERGASVYINDKEVGTISEEGAFKISLQVTEEGSYNYKILSKNAQGAESDVIELEVIKSRRDASLGRLETKGVANSLTASQDGVIFIAEKNHGVEIISIGFRDKVSSDLLATIDTIDAQSVLLSDDESKLYVEDKEGKFHVLDISDLSNPVEIEITDAINKTLACLSEDGKMRYRMGECGLVGENIENKEEATQKFILKDTDIQDMVLVDDDTKLLLAHGIEGLQLWDISDVENPILINSKSLGDDTSGLSLLKRDGILFVANGASGVQIFNLDILLHEMMR